MEKRVMNKLENTIEKPLIKDNLKSFTNEKPEFPEPTATGNEEIAIMKHSLSQLDMRKAGAGAKNFYCTELAIRNISESTIATAIFEVIFYDVNGNIVDNC
jgi:hypothetical protein